MTEIKTSAYDLMSDDVIVGVMGTTTPRNHPWCGRTVTDVRYVGRIRNAQRATDPNMVEITFANDETKRVDAFKVNYIVERVEREDDEDDD